VITKAENIKKKGTERRKMRKPTIVEADETDSGR